MIGLEASIVENIPTLILLFVRVSMIILVLPGVGTRYISQRYRLIIAFVITFVCLPVVVSHTPSSVTANLFIGSAFFTEVIVGAMYGIVFRSIIFALQVAGAIIAQSMSLAQMLGANVTHDAQSSISNILTVGGIAFLSVTGFFESVISSIAESYDMFPIAMSVEPQDLLSNILHVFSNCFLLSVQLSMPFILMAVYYNVLLAVVNRAMPQLLVSFIGVPAVLAASLALFVGLAEPILREWRSTSFEYVRYLGL